MLHARHLLSCFIACASFTMQAFGQEAPTYQVGQQPDGSFVTPANQLVTPAGTQINFSGRPMAVAVRPDHKSAAALNTGSSNSNFPTNPIIVVDLIASTVKQQFSPGSSHASYDGVIYSRDGNHLYFSQDDGHVVMADVAVDGTLSLNKVITLPQPSGKTPNNGGLALSADGSKLYVVMNMANSVAVVDLTSGQVTGTIAVQNAPASIIVVGNRAYVTNQGGRPPRAGEYSDLSAGTPILADAKDAFSITGTVSVIDLSSNTVISNIQVGLQPTAILSAAGVIFVANTNSDSVSVIDPSTDRVIGTIQIQVFPGAQFGSFPNALAWTSHNELAVSLGANNAIALYRWKHAIEFEGLIPSAWYPTQVADVPALTAPVSGSGVTVPERLLIVNTKGTGLGQDVPDNGNPSGKNSRTLVGSVSLVPLPQSDELEVYTSQVASNNGWKREGEPREDRDHWHSFFEARHPIKHVFYVIKENTTYDQVLGDDPRGNGDPSLVQFGTKVTPNEHALEQRYILFDNFYDSGILSADGHQWAVQGVAPDYMEHLFTDFNRSYPSNGGDSLDYLPSAFLWSDALAHGLSVRIYGEYAASNTSAFVCPGYAYGSWTDWYNDSQIIEGKQSGSLHIPVGGCHIVADVPSVIENISAPYPNFNTGIPDQYRFDMFVPEFQNYVKNNNLPNLIVMKLCDDHTSGNSIGYPTPATQNADNDLAVGRLVDLVSHSPYWKDSVIFLVEDDPQNGVDHVDGHRSSAFVIGPYVKRGEVNHTYYTQINMVRTIEDLLGIPPMNQHDALVSPMANAFTSKPDLTAYSVIPNQIPLTTLNSVATNKVQKAWQQEIAKFFPKGPNQVADIADPDLMRHIIWYTNTNFSKPFPGEKRILFPHEVVGTAAKADVN